MLDVLLDVIVPVLTVAAIGGFVGRRLGVPVANLSGMAFYLFSPALVFTSMARIDLDGSETTAIVAVSVVVPVALAVTSLAISGARRQRGDTRAAIALAATHGNNGNLGLPVSLLAFGQAGFDVAVIAFVVAGVLVNSLGVILASSGHGLGRIVKSLLTVPALWAAIAGLLVNTGELDLPVFVAESANTLADAAIPVMLVVLGLQVSFERDGDDFADLTQGLLLRLVAGPVFSLVAATAFGLDGVAQDTLVVLGGTPPAVFITILATQYGAKPILVTRAVVVGTLCSIGTLTVLISMLR